MTVNDAMDLLEAVRARVDQGYPGQVASIGIASSCRGDRVSTAASVELADPSFGLLRDLEEDGFEIGAVSGTVRISRMR